MRRPTVSLAACSILAVLWAPGATFAQAQPTPPAATDTVKASRFGDIAVPEQPAAIALRPVVSGAPPEQWEQRGGAGRGVRNVISPTLTPVLPDPKLATGVAVIIAPGGAFRMLSIDSEGFDVAQWLAARGVAAFVLKYRTVPVSRDRAEFYRGLGQMMASAPDETKPLEATSEALQDAQSAVRLVRGRAAEWGVDPAKVGFVGFSAGAMTTLSVGLSTDKASRPDFIGSIYGPMGARPVPADAPPLFAAIALDDPLFAASKPMALIQSWRDAGRPIEAHLYTRGGHGFGLNGSSKASALWIDEFYAWMRDRKLLKAAR